MEILMVLRSVGDRILAWCAIVVGLVALLLGYLGVKETAYVVEQIPYVVSGGMFGLFLLGTGAVLLLSADLRDQWRALLDVRDELVLLQSAGGPVVVDNVEPARLEALPLARAQRAGGNAPAPSRRRRAAR